MHQIRQPLAIIRSSSQYILETYKNNIKNNDFDETLEQVIQNTDMINDIITDLGSYMKLGLEQMKPDSIYKLIDNGLTLIGQRIKDQKISIEKSIEKNIPNIKFDNKLLLQAYLNLLSNALDSMKSGGKLSIEVYINKTKTPQSLFMVIGDSGDGIPKEIISKIKEPFFTTKKTGIGLGLPIAETIIHLHNGHLNFESAEEKGTRVIIELPFLV
jgi:two-component system nitrogen regulation sensor histidine kinase NtrY